MKNNYQERMPNDVNYYTKPMSADELMERGGQVNILKGRPMSIRLFGVKPESLEKKTNS